MVLWRATSTFQGHVFVELFHESGNDFGRDFLDHHHGGGNQGRELAQKPNHGVGTGKGGADGQHIVQGAKPVEVLQQGILIPFDETHPANIDQVDMICQLDPAIEVFLRLYDVFRNGAGRFWN